jgi:methyltransferase (TIGR00027 family)
MEHGRASRTAYSAAQYRAAHQVADGGRIFTDPLATRILGAETVVDNAPGRRAMRLFIAARTAFAERALAEAVARGTRELVVLGAGLDTFAYRNPYPGLRVVEVDHPDTQAWKRERLAEAGIAIPPTLSYVPVNFETQSLADRLTVAERTFFLWLGVVPYLTRGGLRRDARLHRRRRTGRGGLRLRDAAVLDAAGAPGGARGAGGPGGQHRRALADLLPAGRARR